MNTWSKDELRQIIEANDRRGSPLRYGLSNATKDQCNARPITLLIKMRNRCKNENLETAIWKFPPSVSAVWA